MIVPLIFVCVVCFFVCLLVRFSGNQIKSSLELHPDGRIFHVGYFIGRGNKATTTTKIHHKNINLILISNHFFTPIASFVYFYRNKNRHLLVSMRVLTVFNASCLFYKTIISRRIQSIHLSLLLFFDVVSSKLLEVSPDPLKSSRSASVSNFQSNVCGRVKLSCHDFFFLQFLLPAC